MSTVPDTHRMGEFVSGTGNREGKGMRVQSRKYCRAGPGTTMGLWQWWVNWDTNTTHSSADDKPDLCRGCLISPIESVQACSNTSRGPTMALQCMRAWTRHFLQMGLHRRWVGVVMTSMTTPHKSASPWRHVIGAPGELAGI